MTPKRSTGNSGENSGERDNRGRLRPGNQRAFKRGQSGNPSGRPKGSKTFAVLRFVQAALAQPGVEAGMLKVLAERLKAEARREDLEFIARLTREIGADSVVMPTMTINIITNVDPSKL